MQIPNKFKPFIEQPKTHNIFKGGRGGGKTRTIASLIIEIQNLAPLNVICGREIQKSLKESSFLVLRQEIDRLGFNHRFKINESDGTIENLFTGARSVFTGLQQHTVDSIKSYEGFQWAWIEEAQSVSRRSLETLIPTLRTDGWFKVRIGSKDLRFPLRMFLYSMNPYTWDDPINVVLPESRDDVRIINVNYNDNPWFPKSLEQERLQAKNTMAPDEYLRIWEGVPYENAENAIMSRNAIMESMSRTVSTTGSIVVGADIARFGADATVFVKRKGLQVVDTKTYHKKDTQEVARLLKDFAEGGRVVVDDTGVGGGVTDKLRDMGCNVAPVNFGEAARDKDKYPDVISEMWFGLALQINEIGLLHNNELLAELSGRHYKYTNDERRKVESKEDYKKRTGRHSPDHADATILCFYQPMTGRIADYDVGELGL